MAFDNLQKPGRVYNLNIKTSMIDEIILIVECYPSRKTTTDEQTQTTPLSITANNVKPTPEKVD